MPRNLDRRIELMFPVEAPHGRRKVLDALDAMFRDNVKGRRLSASGEWKVPPRRRGTEPFSAQQFLHAEAERAAAGESPAGFEPLGAPAD
jgi:polyphosphate kinase